MRAVLPVPPVGGLPRMSTNSAAGDASASWRILSSVSLLTYASTKFGAADHLGGNTFVHNGPWSGAFALSAASVVSSTVPLGLEAFSSIRLNNWIARSAGDFFF